MKRPAEALTGVAALGALVAYVWGVDDPNTIITITAALGLVPGLVTGLIEAGGVRGLARKLWRGGR